MKANTKDKEYCRLEGSHRFPKSLGMILHKRVSPHLFIWKEVDLCGLDNSVEEKVGISVEDEIPECRLSLVNGPTLINIFEIQAIS